MSESGKPVDTQSTAAATAKTAMWAALIIGWLGWMFDGMEMGLYSWAVPPGLKELLQTTDNTVIPPYVGYTVALFLLGMSLGGVFFGRLGDKWGRVKTMTVTILVYAVFTGLSGLSQNVWQLAACRFLGAMGLGGEWGCGTALVMESWPNSTRPVLAGALGAASNVGFLVAAHLTKWLATQQHVMGLSTWRFALMVGFFPAILTVAVMFFVKEPAKFKKVAEEGRKSRFSDLFGPELRKHSIIGIVLSAVAVLGMWGVYQAWLQTWVEQLASAPGSMIAPGAARATVSMYMAWGSIIGSFLGGVLAQWMGRRQSYSVYCIGALVAAMALFVGQKAYGPGLLWWALIGGIFAASFFGWLPLYLPELFPTRLRSSGQGLTFNFGRVISAAGVLVTGAISTMLGGAAHACAVMALIWAVGLIVIWFAPETKNCELPE